jgi:hypothetical protein
MGVLGIPVVPDVTKMTAGSSGERPSSALESLSVDGCARSSNASSESTPLPGTASSVMTLVCG